MLPIQQAYYAPISHARPSDLVVSVVVVGGGGERGVKVKVNVDLYSASS